MSALKLEYKRTRDYPESKKRAIEEIARLIEKYKYILVVSITGITAPVLHETRAILRERGDVLKVVKNKLAMIAIKRVKDKKPGIEKLAECLEGQNAFIFTNTNPFSVKLFLDKNKIPREARAGDIAPRDIVVPAGNTGFPPGPILSLFGKLKIPTSIREGSIWIAKDTVVAKKGDVISEELADLLKRLGIKPIDVGIDVKMAYMDGRVLSKDELSIDLDKMFNDLKEAHAAAINLAVNAGVSVPEAMPMIVAKAYLEAVNLAVNSAFLTPETAAKTVAKAYLEALALFNAIKEKKPEFASS